MAYNNYQQAPFWDFVRSFDQSGAGVDHPAAGHPFGASPQPSQPFTGFDFGGPGFGRGGWGGPWGGRGGHRGRHGHRGDGSHERRRSHGSRSPSPNGEHPEGEHRESREAREASPGRRGRRGCGRHGRGGHEHRRGGWGGHGGRGMPPFGGYGPGGFDMNALMASLSQHPLAQTFRNYAEQAGAFGAAGPQRSGEVLVPEDTNSEDSFVPPIDIFSTERAYVLHVALPGARKEDVGVNWDEEKGVLNLAGVVYRKGDEAFLQTLTQGERKVGMFDRTVKLPPGDGEKEEVDGDNITAKLEDGVLVVTVPKAEKEWTEVKRVDIE
ncbi:hypothetical protein HYFRA_00013656 [Hymenoscyphus fraxineus]|uniref:SHSP domain-containing protein n=1 Tax=Hymenoscyphus fraxineus TaxID=746836 RepID=A0A9N9L7U0_9HELO|nr:hypothetical protein HYFRA_00013656 [Hymenoscyphus fraxineus]